MSKKPIIIILIIIVIGLIFNYIIFKKYDFKLNGSDTILLNTSDTWDDPLYTTDSDKNINVISNVQLGIEGDYKVNYTLRVGLFSKTLTRNVYILNDRKNTNFIFNLKGDNPYYLMINHPYEEYGYEAYDIDDGYLTKKVIEKNNINNSIQGNYEVSYEVTNSNGVTKHKKREVIVYSFNFDKKILKEDGMVSENEIILDISDNNYDHITLPDGTNSQERKINYKVTKNDIYLFTIYDINDNYLDYKVNITNIDNEKPTGTCVLTPSSSGGEIIVNAKDNDKIQGYIYQHGNTKTNLMTSEKYSFTTKDTKASVTILDQANNSTTIDCNVIDTVKPKGACILSLLDNGGEITVSASDNNKIKGYVYRYGTHNTSMVTSKKYKINTMDTNATVTIYDEANNSTSIKCNTVDKSNKTKRSFTHEVFNCGSFMKDYWFYEPSISKRSGKIPLVIFFHGAGGEANVHAVIEQSLPQNIDLGYNFPYYVIAPYKGVEAGYECTLNMINYAISHYSVDSKRVVSAGLSAGSGFAAKLAYLNPDRFSGLVLLAGTSGATFNSVGPLTTMPVWVFQGNDGGMADMVNLVNQINKAGGRAKLTTYDGGHAAPIDAFLRPDLTEWILKGK